MEILTIVQNIVTLIAVIVAIIYKRKINFLNDEINILESEVVSSNSEIRGYKITVNNLQRKLSDVNCDQPECKNVVKSTKPKRTKK
jgi:cell division protein FtsL